MMKKLILIPLLFFAFFVNAQFKIGAGAGLNFSEYSWEESSNTTFNGALGINGGLIMEVKLPVELGIEVDVLFSQKGFEADFDDPLLSSFSYETNMAFIDLPVVAKLYMLKVISLQGGLQYSQLLSAITKSEAFGENDVKDAFNSGYLSAVIGFGIDVSKLHFSTRYNFGITKINSGGAKQNMLTFTVGIWLKK